MKTLLLFLSLIVATSQAATVRLYFTDPLTNEKDTNAFYITPVGTNVLSNGGVVGRGVTTRYVPASNGYRTNTLAVGHYSITNRSLGSGVVIRVPETSSLYDYTNLLISGYNTFVTINNYTNSNSGAAVSNVFGLTFALDTRYTNSTAYYAQISSSMTFTQQNSSDSAFYFFIDTNLDGTIDFRRTNWFHVNSGTTWSRTTFTETVPPGAAYGATNISNGTSTMTADALSGAIIYFSTNSASGTVQTNISYAAVTNLTSFGALTNNDTRNVTFLGTVASSGFQGDGNGLTELDADNLIYGSIPIGRISDGLITSNKLDATAYVAFMGGGSGSSIAAGTNIVTVTNGSLVTVHGTANVTQSGLAAVSYPISEQALTGFLRFSSTNTAFIDGAATNAITVVSNAYAWLTITLSGANATTRGAARTYYSTANSLVFTNGATNGLYFVGSLAGNMAVTNAAYPDSGGDFSNTALVGNGGTSLAIIAYDAWNDNESDFNPQTVTMTGTYLYQASYASFNGKHVGDGSSLVNLPAASGVITNNWQSGAGAIFITNTVNVGKMSIKEGDIRFNFQVPYTNSFTINSNYAYFGASGNTLFDAYQFRWGLSSEAYWDLGSWGNFLMRARYIGLEAPNDFSTIRLTDDHRLDGLVKLSGQATQGGLVFSTNNYSGMLAFQAPKTNGAGTYIPGYAGIRAKNATGIEKMNVNGEPVSESELWFYTLIPPQMSNVLGGFRSVGDTNWFAIGKTNSFYVKGLTVVSNYINQWPTVPHTPGDAQFVNSNGYPYILLSTNGGGGGAATWTATNKIGW